MPKDTHSHADMDRSKLRISKACQECRSRKIRCDGGEPCQRCQFRDVACEYRIKARNRMKKSDRVGANGGDPYHGSDDGHSYSQGSQSSAVPRTTTTTTAARSQTQHATSTATRQPKSRHSAHPDQQQRFSSLDTSSTSPGAHTNGLQNHSVAATHRASPSVFLQLYYGPSSNFSLLNSIYHKIEDRQAKETGAAGTKKRRRNGDVAQKAENDKDNDDDNDDDYDDDDDDGDDEDDDNDNDGTTTAKEVEEIGPGLDLFNHRRLYFGDLADGSDTSFAIGGNGSFTDGASMFIDRALAERLLERYLTTFWLILPIWTRDTFRQRLAGFYDASSLLAPGNPDTIIVLLALALGASMFEEELAAQYLYRMAKRWAAALDEMVNVQTVQIALMMSHFASERARPNSSFLWAGTAVRKAVAAGLHKGVGGNGSDSGGGNAAKQKQKQKHTQTQSTQAVPDAARQMRITVWSLYFWEIWLCFSLGRPCSFPESEMDVPFPTEEKLLHSVVTLARIMSKSAACIYRQHYDSLLPLWNSANEIRRELRAFAEQQREDFNFGVVEDPTAGELGVCQTMVSALYHHTLILTFRPFLVLRAKLREGGAGAGAGAGQPHPPPPAWLDTACEYCLDAARHSIAFLIRAFEKNELCRAIRYHAFFIEGASHVLAFELLHDRVTGRANFPWIQLAIRALQLVMPRHKNGMLFPVDLSGNLERMIQSVYPGFRAPEMGSERQHQRIPGDPTSMVDMSMSGPGRSTAVGGGGGGGGGMNDRMYATSTAAPSTAAAATPLSSNHPPSSSVLPPPQMMTSPIPPSLHSAPTPSTIPDFGNASHLMGNNNSSANGGGVGGDLLGGVGLNTLNPLNLNDLNSLSNLSNALPPLLFPFTPFGGLDEAAGGGPHMGAGGGGSIGSGHAANSAAAAGTAPDAPADLTAADLGWNLDFGTMNMEAFLSINPAMPYNF